MHPALGGRCKPEGCREVRHVGQFLSGHSPGWPAQRPAIRPCYSTVLDDRASSCMRLNPTKEAAALLDVIPHRLASPPDPSSDHWSLACRRLRQGRYFLCSNEVTLWSIVVTEPRPDVGILAQCIAARSGASPGPYVVDAWTNRRVIGSMNDMHRLIAAAAEDMGCLDAAACERLINSTPFSYLGMRRPLDMARLPGHQ